jgi:hypothetical protein
MGASTASALSAIKPEANIEDLGRLGSMTLAVGDIG